MTKLYGYWTDIDQYWHELPVKIHAQYSTVSIQHLFLYSWNIFLLIDLNFVSSLFDIPMFFKDTACYVNVYIIGNCIISFGGNFFF